MVSIYFLYTFSYFYTFFNIFTNTIEINRVILYNANSSRGTSFAFSLQYTQHNSYENNYRLFVGSCFFLDIGVQ